jgi:hypothetical protein
MARINSFFKRSWEYVELKEIENFPENIRGIYALYQLLKDGTYKAVYVGISNRKNEGIQKRLIHHRDSPRKGEHWTHFSAFKVQPTINKKKLKDLESLILNIYAEDPTENWLNRQRSSGSFKKIRVN